MARRIVAVFTLLAFVVFSMSCVYKVKQGRIETVAKKGGKARILAFQTKARDYFEFPPYNPATVSGGALVGEYLKTVEFKKDDIARQTPPTKATVGEITTKDGELYRIRTARPAGDSLVCETYLPLSVPLSEVQLAWFRSVNTGATMVQALEIAAAVALIVVVIAIYALAPDFFDALGETTDVFAMDEETPAPPPVYLNFWENYFVDAELHGPTAGQGFTMTEWAAAENVTTLGARTKLVLRNELDEPKATDELRIIVVDHPPGMTVVPDLSGTMHTVRGAVAPKKARDRRGRDILPLVAAKDGRFWMTADEEKNPRKKEDLRDELIFEFPKPRGAKKAKLLISATNTAWASNFSSSFVEVPGTGSYERPSKANTASLAGGRARDWYREDEFYRLRVWVETKNGWQTRQMIYGGGPFVAKDMVYDMNIKGIPGSTLKVKLMPPAGFWKIDRMAVDYSKDSASPPLELMAEEAVVPGLTTGEVLTALAREDGQCLMLESRGDKAEITFTLPLLTSGKERSIILKTVCRYVIRPDVGGTGR
jgi:hypothetical protein